jgi:hypothetical protein
MNTTNHNSFSSQRPSGCDERRSNTERRVRGEQRANVRFDGNGGDRRSGKGRRSTDEGFEVLE